MEALRTVPKKNYMIYSCIFVVTFLIATIAFIYFTDRNYSELKIPVLRGSVTAEITPNDLNEYLNENPNVLLYIGDPTDEESRTLEKELKSTIKRRDLEVVYVNIVDTKDKEEFYKSFIENYSLNSTREFHIIDTPAFVILEDKQIVDIVARNGMKVDNYDIEILLDRNEIKGEEND